jgi:hypothetical protein
MEKNKPLEYVPKEIPMCCPVADKWRIVYPEPGDGGFLFRLRNFTIVG